MLFFSLFCFGISIAGLSAFLIFWPLTLIHIRDRYPALNHQFGSTAFLKIECLHWLLAGHFIKLNDRNLSGLAAPARLALWVMLAGLMAAFILWLANKFSF